MLHIKRRKNPVDYRLCNQTVTLYHWDKETITRTVIEKGAFLDFRKNQSIYKTGSTESNTFLFVLPCSENPVSAGDKIFHGEGPEIHTTEEWRNFIPASVPGLVVVKYVDPKYWQGKLVHIEAGG